MFISIALQPVVEHVFSAAFISWWDRKKSSGKWEGTWARNMHMGECPRRHGLCSPLGSPNQMPWKAMAKQASKQKTEFWKACKYVVVCTKESLSSFQFLGKPNWCFQLYMEVMGETEEGGNRIYTESLHQKRLAFWKCTKLQNRGHLKKNTNKQNFH